MLVIPRKSAESIVIGDNIIVTIIEVQEDEVRLAIEYPRGVTVQRREEYRIPRSARGDSHDEVVSRGDGTG